MIAIIFSALLFGLIHGNTGQLLYTTIMGLILGYIVVKTNSIKYAVIIHIIQNFIGSALLPICLDVLKLNVHISSAITVILNLCLVVGAIILLIKNLKNVCFENGLSESIDKKKMRIAYINVGSILYFTLGVTILITNIVMRK